MSNKSLRRVITAITALAALPAVAQESQSILEETQVWGTRVWASSLALDEDDVAIKQADHISDLLRPIPGVDVGGAHSLNQRITIRSMDDKDLRITIDGANQNTYMYHHMGNLQIHADILQSAEIELGTNSVVNGGLGGSVHFETKTAAQLLRDGQQFGARVQAGYGNNYGSSLALTGYGQLTESLDVLAYYNGIVRDNYTVGGGEILDADGNEIPGTDGEVRGLEGDLSDILLKFGWEIGENQRLELGYEMYKDEGDYSYRPDMGLATDLAITNSLDVPLLWPTEFTRDTLTLNYDAWLGDHTTIKAALFKNTSELWRDERGWSANPAFAASAGFVEGEAENTGLNLLAETQFGNQVFAYGVEAINYDTYYSTTGDGGASSGEDATSTAVFVQDRIEMGRFALIPGVRYNHYELDAVVVDDSYSEVTGALAGEFEPTDNLLFKLSVTQLFKGPEIGEVFTGAGLYDALNLDIEAETGLNTEFSIAWRNDLFDAGVTVFETEIENYIYDYAWSLNNEYWKDNVGDMTLDGYEAYAGITVDNLFVQLTYSVADSELDAYAPYNNPADEDRYLDGARIDRKQGDTFGINLDYELPDIDVALHWDVMIVDDLEAGRDLDGATLDNSKDGFTVHNISARWAPAEGVMGGFSLTVGVDNLFDEFYASQSSRTGVSFHPRFGELYLQDYEPGRNIKATLAYTF